MDTYKQNIRSLGAQRLGRIFSRAVRTWGLCVRLSRFLGLEVFEINLGPKAKKKHNMISRSDFHHGFGDLKHGQNGQIGCFEPK